MKVLCFTLGVLGGLFCNSLTALAATLDEYQKRIEAAAIETAGLAKTGDRDEAAIAEVRRLVPASEIVDWKGGSATTDNSWLSAGLEEYAEETDVAKRRAIMAGLSKRLEAIAQKLDQLRRAQAGERSKDEDKQKLGEILRRQEYQKPPPPEESLFQKWYRKVVEWLARVFPRPSMPDGSTAGLGSLGYILQFIIFAAVFAGIAFAIYKLAPFLAGRFGWEERSKKTSRVVLGERIDASDTSQDLFIQAERLAAEGRLRDAIRKGYIAALCELGDRNIIRLSRQKTNRDYLRDVRRSQARLLEPMTDLTGVYERNWYGAKDSDAGDWEDFRKRYRQAIASI